MKSKNQRSWWVLACVALAVPGLSAAEKKTEVGLSGGVSVSVTKSGDEGAGGGGALASEIKGMESAILKALEVFSNASKPTEEHKKQFDSSLNDFDKALDMVKEGGVLDKAVDKALAAQDERIKLWQTKASDPNLEPTQRDQWQVLVERNKKNKADIVSIRQVIRKLNSDLGSQRKVVAGNKDLFVAMYESNLMDEAKKTLDQVRVAMEKTRESISRVGQIPGDIAKLQN